MKSKAHIVEESDGLPKAIAIVLCILSFAEILKLYFGWHFAAVASRLAFLALCMFLARRFGVREWILASISIALAVGILVLQDGSTALLEAWDRAVFFGAFIYLVTLLKEAAQRSLSVLELGKYLTRQTGGKRYYALAGGGHVMGVLLNFGAISLLTPLIQRGARASSDDPEKIRVSEQQQISALIRGFAWMIMWSPTALTQAVLFTAFPVIDLHLIIPLGICAAIVMTLVGRLHDRMRWRSEVVPSAGSAPSFPKRAALRFGTICVALVTFTYALAFYTSLSAAIALMVVAPLFMVSWIAAHQSKEGETLFSLNRTLRATSDILVGSSVTMGRGAFTLGAAGFIGEAAARLAPIDTVAATLEHMNMPGWLFLAALPVIINIGGQIALSPILIVVFLSAVINSLPVLPADPNLIVFALGAGWAMSMTASPNASATLLISGITNIAPTTLTWRWNGLYSLSCYMLFVFSFYLLDRFLIG